MNYTTEIKNKTVLPTLIEKFRIFLGFSMLVSGVYFGLFSAGPGEGLGLLSIMLSPFFLLTDK